MYSLPLPSETKQNEQKLFCSKETSRNWLDYLLPVPTGVGVGEENMFSIGGFGVLDMHCMIKTWGHSFHCLEVLKVRAGVSLQPTTWWGGFGGKIMGGGGNH